MRLGFGLATTRRNLSPSGAMVQPLAGCEALRGRPVVDRADRLGGVVERGVVAVDLDHGQERGERLLGRQQVAELLLDDVADHRLGLGAEHVERVRRDVVVRRRLQRQQPDLGPVAVRDDDLVAGDDGGDALGGDPDVRPLVLGGHRLTALQQRVAAQGDHDPHGCQPQPAPRRGPP